MDGLLLKKSLQIRRLLTASNGLKAILLMLLSYSCNGIPAPQNKQQTDNAILVQAALIKNFTHLIEWPKNKQSQHSSNFIICVTHSKKLAHQFKTIFNNKKVKGKQVEIINVDNLNLVGCNLLYVTSVSTSSIAKVLKSANQLGILTISAHQGYGQQGIHINFYENEQHLAFELNKPMLDRGGFQVSTQLYQYARIVQ